MTSTTTGRGSTHNSKKAASLGTKAQKGLQLGGKKTQFKKGHVPASRKPIGTEVWSEDKQTYYIKIANPDVWVKKKRYLWEQAHGPIPEGHVIICKDNDPRNVTLDNLLCVSHRAMTSVFQRGLRTEYPEINEALHTLAELEMKLKKEEMRANYNMITELTARIEEWARERGLDTASPDKQMLKLAEEFGELAEGLAKDKPEQVEDSIGDMYVVMTILALQLGLDIEDCVQKAYNEIKNRRGKMINGVFVKESDLKE